MNASQNERRRYYRIDDYVALKVVALSEAELADRLAQSERDDASTLLMNRLRLQRDKHLPNLRAAQQRYPEIASYLVLLEEQIELLARVVTNQQDDLPDSPTDPVNLSAQGIRFNHATPMEAGDAMELHIKLFPSLVRVVVQGHVVNCAAIGADEGGEEFSIAADFTHIREEDRELLVKHIHRLQIDTLATQTFA